MSEHRELLNQTLDLNESAEALFKRLQRKLEQKEMGKDGERVRRDEDKLRMALCYLDTIRYATQAAVANLGRLTRDKEEVEADAQRHHLRDLP